MASSVRGRTKVGVGVAGAICLILLAAGYAVSKFFEDTRPVLSNDLVVGVWRGPAGCEFTFSSDGTFRGTEIPVSLFGPPRTTASVLSGAGAWELTAPMGDTAGKITQVRLRFDELDEDEFRDSFSTRLRSDRINGRLILFWFEDDPDLNHRVVLEKV